MNFTVKFITNVFICFCQKINADIRYIKKMAKFLYIQNVCHQKIPRNLTYQLKLKSR